MFLFWFPEENYLLRLRPEQELKKAWMSCLNSSKHVRGRMFSVSVKPCVLLHRTGAPNRPAAMVQNVRQKQKVGLLEPISVTLNWTCVIRRRVLHFDSYLLSESFSRAV